MTKLTNISLGKTIEFINCDWWVVVVDVYEEPKAYALTRDEVIESAKHYSDGHGAQGKAMATSKTLNAWDCISSSLLT